jgi:predicted RNase H-like HicB family nuclease
MPQTITIAVKVSATIVYDEEAGAFVSRSPLLNIFSQGNSESEAKEALEEAIGMQLRAAYRFDRLHQLLVRAGFTKMTGEGIPPAELKSFPGEYVSVTTEHAENAKQFEIEVPLTLIAAAANNHGWQPSH